LPFFVAGCIAAWRNRIRAAGLLWALLLIYPIPYYLMLVSERYHYPVELVDFLLRDLMSGLVTPFDMKPAAAAKREPVRIQ
jgi:hypothetical protein